MGILHKASDGYWTYFLAMERDLEALSRYVDFATANMTTFSLEMARILLAAGSEADVLLKAICKREDPSARAGTIGAYFKVISSELPNVISFEVQLPRWGLSLVPWEDWANDDPPDWWTSHNKVKHHRSDHFDRANLQYTIESVSAVYVLNLYWNPRAAVDGSLIPMPALFRPGPPHQGGTTFDNFEFGINYVL